MRIHEIRKEVEKLCPTASGRTVKRRPREANMLTYEEARGMIERARDGRRKLENNTWLEERIVPPLLPYYAVRLHKTDVVELHPDGSCTLNSGGWRTVITKDRINRYAPGLVASGRGVWHYYPHARQGGWDLKFPFADGMRVWADGRVEGAGLDESAIRRDILKQIRAYIDGFAAHVVQHGLADPAQEDCWGCYFVLEPAGEHGPGRAPWGQDRVTKPGADHMTGLGHIFEHFREKYYVPSLVWRAMQRRYNPAFCWQMAKADAQRGRPDILRDDLRAYFKHLMPALVEYRMRELAAAGSENKKEVA